jgi:hypothetical protein
VSVSTASSSPIYPNTRVVRDLVLQLDLNGDHNVKLDRPSECRITSSASVFACRPSSN